jgi:hypothetical protein
MPAWYDKAQQDIVSGATTAAKDIPALEDTSAGAAIKQFEEGSTTNPFANAQSTLNQIGTGAANPWITDASGNIRPDTTTAMGGLFQAQNQALNQLMPSYTAPLEGANIASGQFGSLRGQTAVNKAMADAQAQLFERQMQAALQNQQTGVAAATGQGNVGSQGVTSMTNLGQAEQSDPLFASSAVGKIVGGINTPTTTTNETQLSPLNQIGSIVSALGGSISGTDKLLKELFPAVGKPGEPGYKPAQGLNALLKSLGVTGGSGGSGSSSGNSGTGFGDDGFDLGGSGIGDGTTGGGGSTGGGGFGDDGFDLGGSGIGDGNFGFDNDDSGTGFGDDGFDLGGSGIGDGNFGFDNE